MKLLATLLLLAALALPALAQQPAPQAFAAVGIGFDSMASPKTTGWFGGGKLINDPLSALPTYATLQITPHTGGVATTIGSVYARIYANRTFWVAVEGGAGVSTFADAVGSAFQAGGAIGVRIPKIPSVSLVFKPSAIKFNVGTAATPGNLSVAPQILFGFIYGFN